MILGSGLIALLHVAEVPKPEPDNVTILLLLTVVHNVVKKAQKLKIVIQALAQVIILKALFLYLTFLN